jgi:DNA-binding PadR family transcriptional regulator
MLRYLVLGLLRDGAPRHGYAIRKEYRERAGLDPSTGPFYRELARLLQDELIRETPNPPGSDPRRTPYVISKKGAQLFDAWLRERGMAVHGYREDELCAKALFLAQAPPDVVSTILDGWQEDLSLLGGKLERARQAACESPGRSGLDPLPLLIGRRLKHLVADLEFVEEIRGVFEAKRFPARHDDDVEVDGLA